MASKKKNDISVLLISKKTFYILMTIFVLLYVKLLLYIVEQLSSN